MTDSDSTRQLTLADVNVDGCPHEKPLKSNGKPRSKCLLCRPHGAPPRSIVACSHCGKVFVFERKAHKGSRGRWYCCGECFSFAPSQNHRVKDWARLGTLYPTPRYCKNCGTYFSPARSRDPKIAFCSKICREEHRDRNDRRYLAGRKGTCDTCGEVEHLKHGKRGGATRCADCHTVKTEKERREHGERTARAKLEKAVVAAIRRHEEREKRETQWAERKRLKELKRQEAMLTKTCRSCGVLLLPFITSLKGRPPEVCPTCVSETNKRHKAAHRTARKAKQRAVSVESVDPIRVFERDGWRCHMCGSPTPKEKRGSYEDDAPELDHIVTLADGGEHSYRNTACACRSCNIRKGSRSFGQLHLGLL